MTINFIFYNYVFCDYIPTFLINYNDHNNNDNNNSNNNNNNTSFHNIKIYKKLCLICRYFYLLDDGLTENPEIQTIRNIVNHEALLYVAGYVAYRFKSKYPIFNNIIIWGYQLKNCLLQSHYIELVIFQEVL